jgi:hypothetical protein
LPYPEDLPVSLPRRKDASVSKGSLSKLRAVLTAELLVFASMGVLDKGSFGKSTSTARL